MGTAGDLPKAPAQNVVFMEDLTDTQLAQAVRCKTHKTVEIAHGIGQSRKYVLSQCNSPMSSCGA